MTTSSPPLPADAIASIPSTIPDIEMTSSPTTNSPMTKPSDPFLVAFDPNFDIENPKDWTRSRKWAVTDVLSATGFNRIMVSTIMAPALSTIAHELQMSSTESVMALSIYLLAAAFGPLVIGPLSEVYGRSKVLHASNVWFLLWNIVCGFAKSKETLIAARFLAGFGASSIYALAGAVLSDVWRPEQRGRSLSMYLLIPLLGAAVGPIIGGFMAFRTTWRWMFWSTSIFQAVMIAVSFTAFHETYAPTILSRRAVQLRKDTGDARYYTEFERFMTERSLFTVLHRALSRPARLLMFHPIIQINALVEAFDYGVLYIVLASFADLWVKQYGVSVELSGLHYLAIAFGEIAGSQLGAPIMDGYYRRTRAHHPESDPDPEHRIPLTIPGLFIAPVGLLIYGWAAEYRVHWVVVDLGIIVATFGMQLRSIPMSAYIMDAYPEHISSALAAKQLLRSLAAFLFPLFTPIMYGKMGYGWGNSTMALAALALGLPGSFALWYLGGSLRRRMPSTE